MSSFLLFRSSTTEEYASFTHRVQGWVAAVLFRLTYLLTYLLTPWCRVLLEKLTGLQLVKKFPAFHRTGKFITALTSVRHLSLSWARPIQSIYPRCIQTPNIPSPYFHPSLPAARCFPWKHSTPRRSMWGSILPPDCVVSRASIPPVTVS